MVNTFTLGPKLRYIKKLDSKRLGKQRLEAKQIIDILEYYDDNGEMPDQGWVNHKAVLMWKGHTNALKVYFNYVVKTWKKRGYKNNYEYYDVDDCEIIPCEFDGVTAKFENKPHENSFPIWFTFPPFYLAQRAALLMKDYDHYADIFDDDEVEPYKFKGYFWPADHSKKVYKRWSMEYLADLGAGIPAEFRLDRKMVKKWVKDKYVNPTTGRAITKTGAIYKDYLRAAEKMELI